MGHINKRGVNVQYLDGILKITNLILALVAGGIALSLIKVSRKKKELNAWLLLIVALIFFAIQEILGALRAFQIYESPYLTHIVPTIILALLTIALVKQIHIADK
jgi:predicted membrane-bound dolichyl-phosphate-mannose-protein mannosyltransferase